MTHFSEFTLPTINKNTETEKTIYQCINKHLRYLFDCTKCPVRF